MTNKYYVVDGVEALQKFGQDAWYVYSYDVTRRRQLTGCRDRVICVVTTGQAWQFKPYKWQDPKTLFRNGQLLVSVVTNQLIPYISQRCLFPVEQRAVKPGYTRLECHGDEGKPLRTMRLLQLTSSRLTSSSATQTRR
jgi:hypothetical protein